MTARRTWTVAIVGLLGGNVIAMISLAVLATNGGTQVIPDYYEKGAHYDDEITRTAVSAELGWHASVAFTAGVLEVLVWDAAGKTIDGAVVRVTGFQRAHAGDAVDLTLPMVGAGRYRGPAHERLGWHDLTVFAERGAAHYMQHVVVEAR